MSVLWFPKQEIVLKDNMKMGKEQVGIVIFKNKVYN